MPRNNGVYTLPPIYFAETGEIIQPNQHNIPLQDIAQALTGSLPRDGTAAMTGDLPMGGRKVTGLGSATAPGDAVRLDQIPATSGWLSSVAALTMAADRIPYATGVSTAALAVFTAAGRAIVGAVDAAAQRVALGLGALSVKNKAAVSDIDATGSPGASNFLRGDGSWSAISEIIGPVSTASGSSAPFTSIPSWANRITITFDTVSVSGANNILVQLGTSGGYVTSGYESSGSMNGSGSNFTAGFGIRTQSDAINFSGHMVLTRIPSTNRWIENYNGFSTNVASYGSGGGFLTLGGVLDRLQVVPSGGSFDSGQVSISVDR